MTSESDLLRQIQLAATQSGARLFRNNSAQGWVGTFVRITNGRLILDNARPLHAGLAPGSADLIGLTATGRFLSIEVKAERGRLTTEQTAWLDMVRRFGGAGGVARSVDDFLGILAESS